MRRLLITFGAVLMLAACTSPHDVGSQCHGGAVENDCVDGSFCTLARAESAAIPDNPNNEQFFCRALCDGDANCPTGFECRRASGTMQRTCQPSTATAPGSTDGGT